MNIYQKSLLGISLCAVIVGTIYLSAVAIIPNVVDLNKYKDNISNKIEQETGYKFSSEDISFKKHFSPFLKIHLYHTAIMYPNDEVFLQIKDADVKLKLLPLLFRNIVLKDAVLSRPIINITMYKDFSTSLEKFSIDSKNINTNGFKLGSILNESVLKDYKIKFNDETINKTFYLEGNELLLKDLKLNDKAHIILNGAIYENKKEYIKYDLDLIYSLAKNDKKFTFSPFKTILESDIKGDVKGSIKTDKDDNITGNLEINNLSLKINDLISADNSAKFMFKGKEAEINAVLHTSSSDIAKLKGKYSFGKKKFIDINTNAKNVRLENLIKMVSSVSKMLNIKSPVNDMSATGILNADFNIVSDFKKLKSAGTATITNGTITHKELPFPVKDINANINFENNNVKIEQATVKINNNPLNISGIVDENLNAKINASAENLDLKAISLAFVQFQDIPVEIINGKLSFNSQINGILFKSAQINSDIDIKTAHFVDKVNHLPLKANEIKINLDTADKKYKGIISLDKFNTEIYKNKITSDILTFNFDDKNINIPENTFTILNSPVKISGNIKEYNTNKPNINIGYSGEINANNIAAILKEYITLPYKAVGKIKIEGEITGNKEKQKIKAKALSNSENYISYMVIKELLNKPSILNIDCELQNKNINIKDISLTNDSQENKLNKIITVSGGIETENKPVYKELKVSIPNSITGKTNFFGGEDISLKSDIIINNDLKSPTVKGSAYINYYNIKKYLTAIKNAQIHFNEDNIRITAPDVQINDSTFNIVVDVLPKFNGNNLTINNMQINSLNLDMNSLFNIIYTNRELFEKSIINVKQGSATINDFKILDLKAKDISCDFQVNKNIVKLFNINASAYTGLITGKGDYNLSSGILDVNVQGRNVDIRTSLYDLCKFEDNLSGKTDFTAKVSMLTGTYEAVIKSLNGNLQFKAQNGSMGTLGKFGYYLNAKNLMYHGLLNATINKLAEALQKDKTEQYKSAEGSVLFQNGYIISDDIYTTGVKMSLYLKGRHNMLTNQSNLDIYGRIADDLTGKMRTFGDTSLSEIFSGKSSRKNIVLTSAPKYIMDKIPYLYNEDTPTNSFKVNILGNIKAINAINSFEWIAPDASIEETTEHNNLEQDNNDEPLPDFDDIKIQNL